MKSILPSKRVGSVAVSVLVSLGLYGITTALYVVNNESGWYEDWMLYANVPGNIVTRDGEAPRFPQSPASLTGQADQGVPDRVLDLRDEPRALRRTRFTSTPVCASVRSNQACRSWPSP